MEPTDTPQTTVRARLEARRRRISLIRRRVAATALTTFALAFGVIWQTGSIGGVAATAAVSSTATVASVAESTPTATSDDATDGSNQANGLTAVTTSQS
jgi:hypothetical protein